MAGLNLCDNDFVKLSPPFGPVFGQLALGMAKKRFFTQKHTLDIIKQLLIFIHAHKPTLDFFCESILIFPASLSLISFAFLFQRPVGYRSRKWANLISGQRVVNELQIILLGFLSVTLSCSLWDWSKFAK